MGILITEFEGGGGGREFETVKNKTWHLPIQKMLAVPPSSTLIYW